jgi:hypothetical protein
MLKRAHPNLTILLFDLPTQLYVCNQYLSKVFEGEDLVSNYSEGRVIESPDQIRLGKINIIPHWKFHLFAGFKFDLLWNAASFQEMSPTTALSYLQVANGADAMFLMYNIKYKGLHAFPGERGVLTQHYIKNYREIDRAPAALALTPEKWIYFDSFWKRKSKSQKKKSLAREQSRLMSATKSLAHWILRK